MGEGAAVMDLGDQREQAMCVGGERVSPDKVTDTSKSNILNRIGKENEGVEVMKLKEMFT